MSVQRSTPGGRSFSNTVRDLRSLACTEEDADDRELIQHAADLIEVLQKGTTRSETTRSTHRWTPVSEGLPEDQPGGWLVFDINAGRLWFETNLPSWWNRKDERGPEFNGPTVTHWREDFYPLPGPRA